MYDTSCILRRLYGWILVCACLGSTVAQAGLELVIHNGPVARQWTLYKSTGGSYGAVSGMSGSLTANQVITNTSSGFYLDGTLRCYWHTNGSPYPGYSEGYDEWSQTQAQWNAGYRHDVYISGAPPTTTNTCKATITFQNTLPGGYAQQWRVYWVDATHDPHLLWTGYLTAGSGPTTFNAEWDQGSGHCPGTLIAYGEKPGFDLPETVSNDSTNGTRNLPDPGNTHDSPDEGDPSGDGTLTNSPTQGDVSAVLAELRGVARERTQQGSTNLIGQANNQLITANTTLTSINGTLATRASEATLQAATNLLGQVNQNLQALTNLNNLTNLAQEATLRGMSNVLHQIATNTQPITNFNDYFARAMEFAAAASNAAAQVEGQIAANPWGSAGNFSNAAGPWRGTTDALEPAPGGVGWFTNSMAEAISGSWAGETPVPDAAWLTWQQPSMMLLGQEIKSWTWDWEPKMPSNPTAAAAIQAAMNLLNMAFIVGITFMLFNEIRTDASSRFFDLFNIPAAEGSGTTIFGVNVGIFGKIIAASLMVAAAYTLAAHLATAVAAHFSPFEGSATYNTLYSAVTTGVVNGVVSPWLPKILYWVAQVFPFNLALTAIATWITYQVTRDAALRLAYIAVKRITGFLALPLAGLLLTTDAQAQTVFMDTGSAGYATISAPSYTNTLAISFPGAGTWSLQPAGNPGGTWLVPVTLSAIHVGGVSNYVGDLQILAETTLLVDAAGNVALSRPSSVLREQALLNWGTAGLTTGMFFGFVSLIGYIFKRGLRPGNWSGGAD